MMSLAVMLPPSYHVDTWGLVDLGQLGPSSRYTSALEPVRDTAPTPSLAVTFNIRFVRQFTIYSNVY
jgi:hypothetical protein